VTDRLLVYPLLLVTILPLVFLLRDASRWLLVPILRHVVVLAAGIIAIFTGWVGLAWALFVVLIVVPRLVYRWAVHSLKAGHVKRATRLRQVARLGIADPVDSENLPALVRGELRLWQLWSLAGTQQWTRVIEFYETVHSWGVLSFAMQARLAVARAYAEGGQLEEAARHLAFVALAPRLVGVVESEYLAVRTLVGNGAEADLLRHAEAQTAEWRTLLSWRRPGRVTAGLLVVLGVVLIMDGFGETPLYVGFGNLPFSAAHGEWYRPVTAVFLHAGWEHLLMNGVALWLFATAIEKTSSGWRMLVCFLVSGAAANCVSAALGSFDVSVGASGGVFGLVGAFGVAVYRLRAPAQAGLRRQMLLMLALMVVTDFVIGSLEPQIDNMAHTGGFVSGILLALLLTPKSSTPRPPTSIVQPT